MASLAIWSVLPVKDNGRTVTPESHSHVYTKSNKKKNDAAKFNGQLLYNVRRAASNSKPINQSWKQAERRSAAHAGCVLPAVHAHDIRSGGQSMDRSATVAGKETEGAAAVSAWHMPSRTALESSPTPRALPFPHFSRLPAHLPLVCIVLAMPRDGSSETRHSDRG